MGSLDYDLDLLQQELLQDSARIFVDDTESYVQVIENGNVPLYVKGTNMLVDYLRRPWKTQGIRLISVAQETSVGQLAISHTGFQELFQSCGRFPSLLEMIKAFGIKVNNDPSPLPVCQRHCDFVEGLHSMSKSMAVLMPEVPGRSGRWEFTSAQINSEPDILWLSSILLNGYRNVSNKEQTEASANSFHDRFRFKLHLSLPDLENLQRIRRDLNGAIRSLQANLNTLDALRSWWPAGMSMQSATILSARVSNELERSKSLSISLDDTATLVRLELEREQLERSSELARFAASDSSMMLELTVKSQRSAQTLKVITILTLFFLPASFAASVMSMDLIHVNNDGPYKLYFKPDFPIFAVLSGCLLLVTVGTWLFFELRARRLSRCSMTDAV